MTIYNVHLYREMRLYFPGIEAASHEEAARIAADKPTGDAAYTDDECDGENLAALVDMAGDQDFRHSATIDFGPERLRKAEPVLLEALQYALDCLESFKPAWLFGVGLGCAAEKARAALAQATVTPDSTIQRTRS